MKKLKNKDLQRINIEAFKSAEKTPITIVLDNVRSALNVGSVFRTSDAFLIENIILCGITATPPNKEIRKAALGSTDSVNWKYIKNTTDAVKQLIKDGYYKHLPLTGSSTFKILQALIYSIFRIY